MEKRKDGKEGRMEVGREGGRERRERMEGRKDMGGYEWMDGWT